VDALEVIALAVWAFTVAVIGGLVGLVLGNLRLPLVVLLASSPAAGAGANVAISGVSALASTAGHARGGRVNWRLFWWMAAPSVIGAVIGGLISGVLPSNALLAVIALVVLYGAVELLRRPPERDPDANERHPMVSAVAVAFGVGLLGGIVGLILGSLRLPAMMRWVGVSPHAAVGTNAAAGVCVGVGGLVGHLPSGIDWELFAVGAVASIPGAYIGSHLTGRLDEDTLLKAIAAVLIVTGAAMLAQAFVG
jgi:hypothetical protein